MHIRCLAVVGAALALSWMGPMARAGDAAKARRDLNFAKISAESEHWDELDTAMQKVAADMEGLSDAEKASLAEPLGEIKAMATKSVEEEVNKRLDKAKTNPTLAKLDLDRAAMRLDSDEAKKYADPAVIQKLRERVAAAKGGGSAPQVAGNTPNPEKPIATPQPPMSGDLATAASRVRTAKTMLEQGDPKIAEANIQSALRSLAGVPEADRAPVLAEIASLRQKIDEFEKKKQFEEEARRVDEHVSRFVGSAENSIQQGTVSSPEWIEKSEALLATEDTKQYMDAGKIKSYQARLDATRVKLIAHNKEAALGRATPIIKELEDKVAGDPFTGKEQIEAHNAFSELNTLSTRARKELNRVPKDDPAIKAALARVEAADAKIEAASGKWALEKMQEQFAQGWNFSKQGFAGWEAETPDAAHKNLQGLNKTTMAVRSTLYWMNEADTKQTLEKYKDNSAVRAIREEADKTLAAASAKLNEAFNAVLAEAERQPMPTREPDRLQAGYWAHDAADWFAGTQYKDADVARAEKLDAKWKAEMAAIEKESEETLKKMTAEASAAWPRIEMSVPNEGRLNPADADRLIGKAVLIKGYYNRSGWDFDGSHNYEVRINGIPVAGNFEPNVMAAFQEARRRTRRDVDDHINWDLIVVVEGKGQVKRRQHTIVRDADTRLEIGKLETWEPEPCVQVKVIALHAGPVAVGPK